MLSDAMEDYLKAIYELQRDAGGRVSTSAIADHLDVTPPSVTSMLDSLAERGLVDREKYKGVTLTEEGETVALEVVRHHRLLEAYLADHLDFEWTDVHDEADRLEHHISERLEERIADALGDPKVDPHGDPIPDANLSPLEEAETTRLAEAAVGDALEVRRVRHRDDDELRYLAGAGIRPGTELEVVEVAPFGMVTVEGPGGRQSLPEEIANLVEVAPTAGMDR